MIIEQLFCDVDDFCKLFIPTWESQLIESGQRKRLRHSRLTVSEVITLLIWYHQSNYKTFKTYYLEYVPIHLKKAFPDLISYQRFIELIPKTLTPLCAYLKSCLDKPTGISYIDSTSIAVCHTKRIKSHRVFDGLAEIGKTTKGWFYGFKLHLVCNHRGGLTGLCLTPANTDDRKPVEKVTQGCFGKLFGDKGYISCTLTSKLSQRGVELITSVRKNMKAKLISSFDKALLRKRSVIESINHQLKFIFSIEHTRHRSPINAFAHIISGIIAYCQYPNKAAITIDELNHLAIDAP